MENMQQADIFALGAMFYRLCTGYTIFEAKTPVGAIAKTIAYTHNPRTARIYTHGTGMELMDQLIKGMIHPNPAHRPDITFVRQYLADLKGEYQDNPEGGVVAFYPPPPEDETKQPPPPPPPSEPKPDVMLSGVPGFPSQDSADFAPTYDATTQDFLESPNQLNTADFLS
jgi:hypothetical protein